MKNIKLFCTAIFYIFFYFILTILLYSTFYKDIYNETNLALANAAMIFVDLLILFIFIIIFRKTIVPDFYEFKKNIKKHLKENYKYYLIGLLIMVISNLIISFLIKDIPTNEEINRQYLFLYPISSIISMVITAPIIEELITKKIFKDIFKNEWVFILISGIIFGSLHLLSVESLSECLFVIPYAALGCALSKIYFNSNNIWSNIFFHSLHNFIAILIIFIGV